MRSRKREIGVIVVVVLAAVGAFWVTVSYGRPPGRQEGGGPVSDSDNPLARWLRLSEAQAAKVEQADPDYTRDVRQLERLVQIERLKLATLVETSETTDEELKAQFEKLAQAHLAIHRRTAKFVIAIRPHLNDQQRSRFLHLLGRQLRGGGGGHGSGPGMGHDGPPDGRPGRPDGPRGGREGMGRDGRPDGPPRHPDGPRGGREGERPDGPPRHPRGQRGGHDGPPLGGPGGPSHGDHDRPPHEE